MEFQNDIDQSALEYFINKVAGAKLLLACDASRETLVLHISAELDRLYVLADELGLMKRNIEGKMVIFSCACLEDFETDKENVLTEAECQFLVKYALESVKPPAEEFVPGSPKVKLCPTRPLVQTFFNAGLITDIYTLHDKEYVKRLAADWYRFYRRQPLDRIRQYFGESIGMYFGFLGFYSRSLIIPSILSVLQYFVSYELLPFFCIFYLIWITVFLELWKRKSSIFAYRWGTILITALDAPRAEFVGEIGRDPVTGRDAPQYPLYKTLKQIYCVSVPIILVCLIIAGAINIATFWVEDWLVALYGFESYVPMLPSIINSIWIALLPTQYSKFATWLTNLENHRTQTQYDRHR